VRIVRKISLSRFAPTEAFLHGLAGGGHGHGVEPPAFLGIQRLPVAESIGDVDEKTVAGFSRQKAEADDLAG
jgi:hypothetical protein